MAEKRKKERRKNPTHTRRYIHFSLDTPATVDTQVVFLFREKFVGTPDLEIYKSFVHMIEFLFFKKIKCKVKKLKKKDFYFYFYFKRCLPPTVFL
jgi:hypothetical protein